MKSGHHKRFTLTELLVGTAILLIMMTMLSQILGTLTKGWTLARSNARVYERAQIIFNQVGNDFQTAIAGKQGGKPIGMWWDGTAAPAIASTSYNYPVSFDSSTQNAPAGPPYDHVDASTVFTGNVQMHMICLANENSGDGPSEVHYCYQPPADLSSYGQITRLSIKDSDTATAAYWDFLKPANNFPFPKTAPEGHWTQTPVPGPVNYYPLIDGVIDFRLKVSYHKPNELPDAVMVSVTLVDSESVDNAPAALKAKRINASRRSFTKVFFLGRDRRLGEPKTN